MQHPELRRRRRIGSQYERVRRKPHWFGAVIVHRVDDGEQVVRIDRDMPRECQALTIVVGELDVASRRELVALHELPLRIAARPRLIGPLRRDPTELRQERTFRSHRR